jgi:hypothetical protein
MAEIGGRAPDSAGERRADLCARGAIQAEMDADHHHHKDRANSDPLDHFYAALVAAQAAPARYYSSQYS